MTILRVVLIVILSFSCLHVAIADGIEAEYFELAIDDETSISISKFGNGGDRILWIPTEYGIQQRHEDLLSALAALRHEVWLSELHESYFVPGGRKSYTEIPVDDLSRLIEKSLPDDGRKLFIVSTGRGATLALLALNHWQKKSADSEKFAGLIMIHPNVQADTPNPGSSIRYLPVVDTTQLPIFIIQPKKSEKYWYLNSLTTRLTESGSQVFTQVIDQVSDGFHVRPDASEYEKQAARKLPSQISSATRLLAQTHVTVRKQQDTNESWQLSAIPELLQPYTGNTSAPALILLDTSGKKHDLQSYRGKVVVINFWATWCPPCVEEIPSLGRLQKVFSKDDLLVLSVDVGESKKEVETFLTQIPADFPVLLDSDGSVFKHWKVTAFPTTFVINKNGLIELAYYGGLEWDKPEVIIQLETVVQK